jgi:hypothetical protein
MRMGRSKVALILTEDERVRLDSLAHRARTAPHLARRARIILACAEGHDNKTVAKRLRMSPVTVCKWRGRFVRERLDGLYDEPRPGAPRQISDEQIEQVIVRTLETTRRAARVGRVHARGLRTPRDGVPTPKKHPNCGDRRSAPGQRAPARS